jgi:AI-2 transport protein TqsA
VPPVSEASSPVDSSVDSSVDQPAGRETGREARRPAREVLPRGLVVILGAAGAVVAVAGMRSLDWMLGPVFLALMLVVAVAPVQSWMLRHRMPRWLATIAVLLILYAVLIALVSVLAVSVAQLAGLLPSYATRASELLASVQVQLAHRGVGPSQINDLVNQVDLGRVTTVLTTVLSSLTSTASMLFFLLATLFFMGLDAAGFPERLEMISRTRPAFATALTSFAHGTRRYLVVSSIFGVICSVLDMVALSWLTVPLPVLWGVLAFITNYIPNIGFFVGLVPPALLGLLDGGVREMVLVIIAYMAINVVIQTVIQPKFVGDVVGLSVTVTFLATAFWAWVLGPLGALLAIPLTLLTKALLIDVDPGTRWLDVLIGSPDLSPDPPAGKPADQAAALPADQAAALPADQAAALPADQPEASAASVSPGDASSKASASRVSRGPSGSVAT